MSASSEDVLRVGLSGWGYYYYSNALYDHETGVYSILCGATFSYCPANFINSYDKTKVS